MFYLQVLLIHLSLLLHSMQSVILSKINGKYLLVLLMLLAIAFMPFPTLTTLVVLYVHFNPINLFVLFINHFQAYMRPRHNYNTDEEWLYTDVGKLSIHICVLNFCFVLTFLIKEHKLEDTICKLEHLEVIYIMEVVNGKHIIFTPKETKVPLLSSLFLFMIVRIILLLLLSIIIINFHFSSSHCR